MSHVVNRAGRGIVVAALACAIVGGACTGGRMAGPGGGAGADGSGGASPGSGGAGSSSGGAAGQGTLVGPTFSDGTRLKAQSYSFEGTAPLFVGIYDAQEKVACEFRQATDGKLRCLPANAIGAVDPATVLPPERWQEGTEMVGPATGLRLRQSRIGSTDGGAFPNWLSGPLADDDRGEPCLPDTTREVDGTGAGLCLPRNVASARGIDFSDAGCTQVLATTAGPGVVPRMIVSFERELFAVGERFEGPTFMKLGTGTASSCLEVAPGGADYYRIGEGLPADTVAKVLIVPRGAGRLALQTIEFEGQGLAHVRHRMLSSPFRGEGVYFDRHQGMMCRPTWTVAGELRCTPDVAEYEPETWLTNFADPACTRPLLNVKVPMVVVLRRDDATGRQLAVEVRRVSQTGTQTAYTRENSQTRECHEYIKGSGYPLGDVLPLETFARVEASTGG